MDTVRSATYRYFNTRISFSSFTIPSVLVILREAVHGNLPGRAISNVDEVRQFFNRNRESYLYMEKKLELMKPSDQIATLAKTDVFIGALGSGFANVIYMLPGSVVISYSPPHVGGFFFDTLCEMSRVHYIVSTIVVLLFLRSVRIESMLMENPQFVRAWMSSMLEISL